MHSILVSYQDEAVPKDGISDHHSYSVFVIYIVTALYQHLPISKNKLLKKRVQIINDEKNDLFISLHLNTYPSETVSGAQVFHGENELSMQLAQYLQDQLIQLLGNNKSIK